MKELEFKNTTVYEEISYRIIKNFTRLEGEEYRPDTIMHEGAYNWPGDWEGRTLLALVLLSQVAKREAAYLSEIMVTLDGKLNELGYFGEIEPEGIADEQQLSSHNWYLRALIELYLWKGGKETEDKIKRLVENLYLPTMPMFQKYPLSPSMRASDGGASGHRENKAVNGWLLSTDIGCAYMSLDALSQYYEVFSDERVLPLLEEMISNFRKIDFIKTSMQTHASLSANRGIIRYYNITKSKKLLTSVESFFSLYTQAGMTENYANYNWFGRPTWTEPCAIIDSYLLAVELFKATKDIKYVEMANRILYNGMGHAQRENGGFGCDFCSGAGEHAEYLMAHPDYYEAYWCCTMRGGEGLSRAAINSVIYDAQNIYFINYQNMKYDSETLAFKVHTEFPYEGKINLNFGKVKSNFWLYLYIPKNVDAATIQLAINGIEMTPDFENGFVKVYIKGVCSINMRFEIALSYAPAITENKSHEYETAWHGVLELGVRVALPHDLVSKEDIARLCYIGKGQYSDGTLLLQPVNDAIYTKKEELMEQAYQLLYR